MCCFLFALCRFSLTYAGACLCSTQYTFTSKVIHAYSNIGNPYVVPEEQSDDAIYATVSAYYYFADYICCHKTPALIPFFLFIIAAGLEE